MPPFQPPPLVGNIDFLTQFMAGMSAARQQQEEQRRQQMMQEAMANDALDRQMRAEHLKIAKTELDAKMKRQAFEDRLTDIHNQAAARDMQAKLSMMAPPTAAEQGIQQSVPDVGPDVSQIRMAQQTAAIPQLTGGPDIQMPVATPRQQNMLAALVEAEAQRKKRSELQMEADVKHSYDKTPAEIQAEAEAKARGERLGAPPIGPRGTWTEAVGADGQPVLFNAELEKTKPYPVGVTPKEKPTPPTAAKAQSFLARGEHALKTIETPMGKDASGTVRTDSLEDRIAKRASDPRGSFFDFALMYNAPDSALDSDQKRYRNAATEWIDSYLRPDSGAAISKDEISKAYKTYFVQAGDDSQTVAEKANRRRTIMQGLAIQANKPMASASSDGSTDEPPPSS